jgi:ubiquinone/menaquinone biosynthesis C-methylase UbiE
VERYVIRGGRPGYERLQVLARTALPETSDLLDRAGAPSAGGRCLDLGCGSGDVTFELARRVGPGGQVTGIDQDAVKLALAGEAAAEQGLANITFTAGDVYEWHESATYDLVYSRFLLHHLSRPVDVLRAMWAGVRPGGVVVVEDADFAGGFCAPPNAGHEFFLDAYARVLERRGGDADAGRKLYGLCLEAGIPNVNLSARQRVHTTPGDAKALMYGTLEATSEAIVGEGIATEDELDAALADLAAFTEDPATVIGEPRTFQVWARR